MVTAMTEQSGPPDDFSDEPGTEASTQPGAETGTQPGERSGARQADSASSGGRPGDGSVWADATRPDTGEAEVAADQADTRAGPEPARRDAARADAGAGLADVGTGRPPEARQGTGRTSSGWSGSSRSGAGRPGTSRSAGGRSRPGAPGTDLFGELQRWFIRQSAKNVRREISGQVRRSLGGSRPENSDIWDTATTEIPPEVGESPECQWCPICRAARQMRESGPGLGGQLTGAGTAVASAVQDAIGALDGLLSRSGGSADGRSAPDARGGTGGSGRDSGADSDGQGHGADDRS